MSTRDQSTSGQNEPMFVVRCAYDAPRELLFKAWSEPERMASWWGPHGFTMAVCRLDLRLGGVLHYCMRSPDGKDYWGKGVYREIVQQERLVFVDCFSGAEGNFIQPTDYGMTSDWPSETLVSVVFSDCDGKSEVTITSSVSDALAEQAGARQGWTESLVRLSEYLARETRS